MDRHDDAFAKERDLKWENDTRRTCWSSGISREITDKIIQAHRTKQEKKDRVLDGKVLDSSSLIPLRTRARSLEEIIIRRSSRSRSPSPSSSYASRRRARRSPSRGDDEVVVIEGIEETERNKPSAPAKDKDDEPSKDAGRPSPPPGPPTSHDGPTAITAPTLVQEVITHYRHIDHGFEMHRPTTGTRLGGSDDSRGEDDQDVDASTEGGASSSTGSSSTTRPARPHVIHAPTLHQDIVTEHRRGPDFGGSDARAEHMVRLLENILQTLREEVTVKPMIRSAGEPPAATTAAGQAVGEALVQEEEPQKKVPPRALPPPSRRKKHPRGKQQVRNVEYAR